MAYTIGAAAFYLYGSDCGEINKRINLYDLNMKTLIVAGNSVNAGLKFAFNRNTGCAG